MSMTGAKIKLFIYCGIWLARTPKGTPKKFHLKNVQHVIYNTIHKMAIYNIILQQCYVYVSAKLRCVLYRSRARSKQEVYTKCATVAGQTSG